MNHETRLKLFGKKYYDFPERYDEFEGDRWQLKDHYKASEAYVRLHLIPMLEAYNLAASEAACSDSEDTDEGLDLEAKQNITCSDSGIDTSFLDETGGFRTVIPGKVYLSKNNTLHVVGRAVVAGDFHIPCHDPAMVDMLCSHGDDYDTLIINGDFANLDEFSRFPNKQRSADWDAEEVELERVIRQLLDTFYYIIVNMGNHEQRFPLRYEDLFGLIVPDIDRNRVIYTQKDYIIAHNGMVKPWRINHGRNYSAFPGRAAARQAQKYGCNVIHGHTHLLGMIKSRRHDTEKSSYYNEDYIAISGGHLVDPYRQEYLDNNTTLHGEWKQGFVLLERGDVEIVSPLEPQIHKIEYEERLIY